MCLGWLFGELRRNGPNMRVYAQLLLGVAAWVFCNAPADGGGQCGGWEPGAGWGALFLPAPELESPPVRDGLENLRPVIINQAALDDLAAAEQGLLHLNYAPDCDVMAIIESVVIRSPDRYTLLGRRQGDPASTVVVTCHDGLVVGSVRAIGLPYLVIEPMRRGIHLVGQLTPEAQDWVCGTANPQSPHDGKSPHDHQCVAPDMSALAGGGHCGPGALRQDGPIPVIDLLMLYTPIARAQIGQDVSDPGDGTDAMLALIHSAVDAMNWAMVNSQARARIRLLDAVEIDYVAGDYELEQDLICMRIGTPDFFDQCGGTALDDTCAPIRNAYGADLVCLVVETKQQPYGGIAQPLYSFNPASAEVAVYAVLKWSTMRTDVLAHEVGHLLGAGHDHAHDGPQFFDYSAGHRFWYNMLGTIMAYGGSNSYTYSNPDVLIMDSPSGVPEGEPGAANNARTITETAAFVASHRAAVVRPCMADLNQDGAVNLRDIGILLATYELGVDSAHFDWRGDIDGDADVDLIDLGFLLDSFGADCEP
jgi:hypothetical protein